MNQYLIVGHSSGIGQAIAQKLSAEHRVYGTHCKHQPQTLPQNTSTHFLDVLQPDPDLGFLPPALDGLVYCPGAILLRPFARLSEADFLNDYKLQLLGAVKVIQACLPRLKNSPQPGIVLFSTVAVQTGFNFHSVVSASKGAIEGLTRALAAELSPTIRVNCIAPSLTHTPMTQALLSTPEKIEAQAQRHPLKKIGSPDKVADAAVFLLQDSSAWVTGQILRVDGGISSIR